ncbi:receptor-like protein 43 [Magnolia sinica]|uniref:receptor-like protein 43 n=1 Tax=Magnolia sinica TaxID=86752 RepID=UPI00265A4B31|nr:receptor-like protein 43 [Magnolia sinica]
MTDTMRAGMMNEWQGRAAAPDRGIGQAARTSSRRLNLADNRFDASPIPSGFEQLTRSLRKLILRGCSLSSRSYYSIRQLQFLSELDLSDKHLSSVLPNFIGNFSYLTLLHIQGCNLSGSLPSFLANLSKLDYLDLSFNELKKTDGRLDVIQNASSIQLEKIVLDHNKFQGMVPSFIFKLMKLEIISLSFNNFSGVVELGLFQNFKNLSVLNLSNKNQSIEDGGENRTTIFLCLLSELDVLDLSSNMIEGPLLIPPPSTSFFSISNNKLSGEIPMSICNTTSLRVLDLSRNQLRGQIPQCLGEISDALVVLNLQGNELNGTLLQTFKEEYNLQTLILVKIN